MNDGGVIGEVGFRRFGFLRSVGEGVPAIHAGRP